MYTGSRVNSLVNCRGFQVVSVIISTLLPLVAPIEASKEKYPKHLWPHKRPNEFAWNVKIGFKVNIHNFKKSHKYPGI